MITVKITLNTDDDCFIDIPKYDVVDATYKQFVIKRKNIDTVKKVLISLFKNIQVKQIYDKSGHAEDFRERIADACNRVKTGGDINFRRGGNMNIIVEHIALDNIQHI